MNECNYTFRFGMSINHNNDKIRSALATISAISATHTSHDSNHIIYYRHVCCSTAGTACRSIVASFHSISAFRLNSQPQVNFIGIFRSSRNVLPSNPISKRTVSRTGSQSLSQAVYSVAHSLTHSLNHAVSPSVAHQSASHSINQSITQSINQSHAVQPARELESGPNEVVFSTQQIGSSGGIRAFWGIRKLRWNFGR